MAILFNEKTGVITLQTENTAYQMKIGLENILLHLYYGKKIGDSDLSYLIPQVDRGFSGNPYKMRDMRTFSLDTLPQEFSGFGVGDYRKNSIKVINADGSFATDLRYVTHKVIDGKYKLAGLPSMYCEKEEAQTLVVELKDQVTNVVVELYYGVIPDRDIITRAAKVINNGEGAIRLENIMSTCIDFNRSDLDMITFHGRHAMERLTQRSSLVHGKQSIGSVRGTSSHHYNPFVILCDKDATEDMGGCYGMSFIYSGNFVAEAEVDQCNTTRFVMGINPEAFSFVLEKDETFIAPEVAMAYSAEGLTKLSQIYHKAYRHNLCRGKYKLERRPVLINNWEATYFGFDTDKLINIAKDASELGIEMFVMDDGWFGKRDDDNSGLGDWYVNENKLKGGLKHLVDEVNKLGMKFGIWFEPEMVSEDSDLYREHPDWAIAIPGRDANRSRNQLVLDFSRKEVRDYIYNYIHEVLSKAPIEYVKWDMNRSICDVWSASLPADKQGEVYHRYVLGLYDLLERLTTEFPNVLFEGCSGGGGRFDAGMLYYHPQIWCSDNTDAIERLDIQYGTSFGYPISAVGSHVSACPNHQTGRTTPFNTRGVVAMAGTFGYELDINKLSEEEKIMVKEQVATFKENYDLIQNGLYYRLTSPNHEAVVAWQVTSEDKTQALVSCVTKKVFANGSACILKVKGLEPNKMYCVNEKEVYLGEVLMNGGILLPVPKEEYEAVCYRIREQK
ncbi:MAG: alpha-galactosidase [Cellulosilyticaceae bacterium]